MVLVAPSLARLEAYAAALRTGWSPSNVRDVGGEQLAAIAHDAAGFVAQFGAPGGTVTLRDGRVVPRLPGPVRWMWQEGAADGAFCGTISLHYVPGTEALPAYVLGHIGYAVVPWKRRQGHATAALRAILPLAVAAGLRHVDLTCDDDNRPSQKVIERNGGVLVSRMPEADRAEHDKLLYRIALVPGGAARPGYTSPRNK